MTRLAIALRRPAARRLMSRACANLLAVVAITSIFALKMVLSATVSAHPVSAHPASAYAENETQSHR